MAEVQIPVRESRQVESAFYDAETYDMRVVFRNGAQYLYPNTDQETADSMANTPWNDLRPILVDYVKL